MHVLNKIIDSAPCPAYAARQFDTVAHRPERGGAPCCLQYVCSVDGEYISWGMSLTGAAAPVFFCLACDADKRRSVEVNRDVMRPSLRGARRDVYMAGLPAVQAGELRRQPPCTPRRPRVARIPALSGSGKAPPNSPFANVEWLKQGGGLKPCPIPATAARATGECCVGRVDS
jgi:hypothetical protein